MLSFEFSAFDLVLSIAMIVLIVLFLTTIWKLNPTKETKQSQDEEVHEEEQEPSQLSPQPKEVGYPQTVQTSRPYGSWQSPEKTVAQRPPQTPKLVVSATTEGVSEESLERATKPDEYKEPTKPAKATFAKQSPRNADGKDCLHHFGYLNELPRNTPIPGECFGCQKIVDCLVTKKGKS